MGVGESARGEEVLQIYQFGDAEVGGERYQNELGEGRSEKPSIGAVVRYRSRYIDGIESTHRFLPSTGGRDGAGSTTFGCDGQAG